MKNLAILLILAGSGLAAFGISGFSGTYWISSPMADIPQYRGELGWTLNNQIQIVVGVIFLVYGVILRKDSK
jgi:hypothetical protein